MQTTTDSGAWPRAMTETSRVAPADHEALVGSGHAPVDGLRMYREIHRGGRPRGTLHPLVGLANVVPALGRFRPLIVVAVREHGRTSHINRPMSLEQDASAGAALLDYVRVAEADVSDESGGGLPAAPPGVRHPGPARRVAIAMIPDAGHFVLNDELEKLLSVAAVFLDQPAPTVPLTAFASGDHPGETR